MTTQVRTKRLIELTTWVAAFSLLLAACSNLPAAAPKTCEGTAPCPAGVRCKSANDCDRDAGFACTNGACARPCGAGDTCRTGEVCGKVPGGKRCLALCQNGICTGGAGCETWWPTRQQVCADVPFTGACASVMNQSKCGQADCGRKQFTTECTMPMGYVCPGSSVCDPLILPTGGCFCPGGFDTVKCDGSPCLVNGLNVCQPPDYHCRPRDLPTTTCTDEPHAGGGQCTCADGRSLPFVCGETSSCEQRCFVGCSLTAQDCPDAFAAKCTVRFDAPAAGMPNSVLRDRPTCVASTGSVAIGAKCQLAARPDGGQEVGWDDCAKGGLCVAIGAPPDTFACRKLCSAKADCATGEVCLNLALAVPPIGVCLPGCTIGGIECGAGKSCSASGNVEQLPEAFCKVDGPNAAGAACPSDAGSGCVANHACRGGVCRPTCSPQKPCPTGTCDEPNGPGICQ